MQKKLKDLVVGDTFMHFTYGLVYDVVQLFPKTKQFLAYVPGENCYTVFSVTSFNAEEQVEIIPDDKEPLCMTGKDLHTGDRFLWADKIDCHIKVVVYATDEWIVFKVAQENGRIHYGVIYKGSRVWEEKIILCE